MLLGWSAEPLTAPREQTGFPAALTCKKSQKDKMLKVMQKTSAGVNAHRYIAQPLANNILCEVCIAAFDHWSASLQHEQHYQTHPICTPVANTVKYRSVTLGLPTVSEHMYSCALPPFAQGFRHIFDDHAQSFAQPLDIVL